MSAPAGDFGASGAWTIHDFGVGRGLEIGALNRPIVTRETGDVSYLDVHDTADLAAHYEGDTMVDAADLVEVDFALHADGEIRSMAEAVGDQEPFAWVVASHVVEHVPDLIGWLAEVAQLVEDDGHLVLVVPDMRYTFDLLRPATTLGAVLQAHRDGDVRPSARAVFDYFHDVIEVKPPEVWDGAADPTFADRRYSGDFALQMADQGAAAYVDAHVWLFSPDVLVEQVHELRRLGLCSWWVEQVIETPRGEQEFVARLRRLPRERDPATADPAGELRAPQDRPHWLTVAGPPADPDAVAEIERLTAELAKSRRIIGRQRKRVHALRAELAELQGTRRSLKRFVRRDRG